MAFPPDGASSPLVHPPCTTYLAVYRKSHRTPTATRLVRDTSPHPCLWIPPSQLVGSAQPAAFVSIALKGPILRPTTTTVIIVTQRIRMSHNQRLDLNIKWLFSSSSSESALDFDLLAQLPQHVLHPTSSTAPAKSNIPACNTQRIRQNHSIAHFPPDSTRSS